MGNEVSSLSVANNQLLCNIMPFCQNFFFFKKKKKVLQCVGTSCSCSNGCNNTKKHPINKIGELENFVGSNSNYKQI